MKQISWSKTIVETETGYNVFVGNRSIGWIVMDNESGYWDVEPNNKRCEKVLSALCKLWRI